MLVFHSAYGLQEPCSRGSGVVNDLSEPPHYHFWPENLMSKQLVLGNKLKQNLELVRFSNPSHGPQNCPHHRGPRVWKC